MSIPITNTIADTVTNDETMPKPNLDRHVQVDSVGAGTLTLSTRVSGQTGFNEQGTVLNGTVIIDMVSVAELRLVAAGGSAVYTITPYRDQ
jgi:hypothetical protein